MITITKIPGVNLKIPGVNLEFPEFSRVVSTLVCSASPNHLLLLTQQIPKISIFQITFTHCKSMHTVTLPGVCTS